MASLVNRKNSTCVKYTYRDIFGNQQQMWETYTTKLEAARRKAFIDSLQEAKDHAALREQAEEYRRRNAAQQRDDESPDSPKIDDFESMTFDDFFPILLPKYATKKRLSPNTVDNYKQQWQMHGSPYLGKRVMNGFTAEDMDAFVTYLSMKKCDDKMNKRHTEQKTLSSGTVRKNYNIVSSLLRTAMKWGYITQANVGDAPVVKTKKRKAKGAKAVFQMLNDIRGVENALLHLAVHLSFVCSLRSGELCGYAVNDFDLDDGSCWINQTLQRVSDSSLALLPDNEIIRVFPKIISESSSSLVLKPPKTEDSARKQYLPRPLVQEIRKRLEQIERDKAQYGEQYNDYGLLFAWPNGDPIEPHRMEKWFKEWQTSHGIDDPIDIQGLRKSGEMHKIRISGFNYQLVAENGGHSPEVLMSNYDEVLDDEKRELSRLIEKDFYPALTTEKSDSRKINVAEIVQQAKMEPSMLDALLSQLLNLRDVRNATL